MIIDRRSALIRLAGLARGLVAPPRVTEPILFNTPEADKLLAELMIFPESDPWNRDISDWPVHPDSKAIVASIGGDKPLRSNYDMNFVIAPDDQPLVPVELGEYASESDKGPYPVPTNTPVEGWPFPDAEVFKMERLSLEDHQADVRNQGGDRHAIVVVPGLGKLYEFYAMKRTATGWRASQASIFDLKANRPRPDGWTSTDAAGLPLFPAIVRYDELQRDAITHALRFTVRRSRNAYVAPARHFASRLNDPDLPRMGERFRLRRNVSTRGFSPALKTICAALKRHGMFVADNGIEWAISIAPDPRIPILHEELRKLRGKDFEVVRSPRR